VAVIALQIKRPDAGDLKKKEMGEQASLEQYVLFQLSYTGLSR
jgi:hypothetical protein